MKKGAKDVSIYHGITKKGRPTNLVSVICDDQNIDKIWVAGTPEKVAGPPNCKKITKEQTRFCCHVIIQGA